MARYDQVKALTDIININIVGFIFLIFIALIALLIFLGIPYIILYFLYTWLSKKGYRLVGLALIITLSFCLVYWIYTAIYPTDSFYFSEFKEVTLRDAPKSAKIIRKDASYPDFHGDYCSASLMTVSADEYFNLLKDLTGDRRITKNKPGDVTGSSELSKVMGNFKTEQITYSFTRKIDGQEDHYLFIGFLDDKKTIVISVCVS